MVEEPVEQETEAVTGLAKRVSSLGAEHPLFPHAALLSAGVKLVEDALAAQTRAIFALREAEAAEEVTQAALRRQLDQNYGSARSTSSRKAAERLFPKWGSGRAEKAAVVVPPTA